MSTMEDGSRTSVQSAGPRPIGGPTPCPQSSSTGVPPRSVRRNAARAWRAAARLADRTGWTAPRDLHVGTQHALVAERLRTGRLLARIRLAGITVALAVDWLLPKCFAEGAQYQSSLGIFGI
jgi:hypothetical protein